MRNIHRNPWDENRENPNCPSREEFFSRGRRRDRGCNRPSNPKKIMFGLLIALAGAVMLLFNTGVLPYEMKAYFFNWPLFFIGLGLINFADRRSWFIGFVFTLVGGLAYLHKFYNHFEVENFIFPILLIALGLYIVLKRLITPAKIKKMERDDAKSTRFTSTSDEYIDETNIFSGSERIFTGEQFKGGSITNVFGGSELDLTKTILAPGKNILEINSVFGGVNLYVPHDWKVTVKVNAVLGAFEDKRYYTLGAEDMLSDRELIITGNLVFSGGELKSR
jgi:predicted membrane protein